MSNVPVPPFALPTVSNRESVQSEDYVWDNAERGPERYVIVQQTLSGCGRFRWAGREWPVPAGSAFIALVPEPSVYFFQKEDAPNWVFRWINFEGESACHLWGELRNRFGAVIDLQEGSTANRALGRLIDDLTDRKLTGIQALAEAAHSVYVSCWEHLENAAGGPANPASNLRELIQTRYVEPVNIKQLCAEVGQSREHLTRIFKQTYGLEPAAYLRQLRLNAAERYLRRSNLAVAEIARRTGFAGATQFTRSFLAANGQAPTDFRRQNP